MLLNTFCHKVHLYHKFKDTVRRMHIHQSQFWTALLTKKKIRLGYSEGMLKNTECVYIYEREANHDNVGNFKLSLIDNAWNKQEF